MLITYFILILKLDYFFLSEQHNTKHNSQRLKTKPKNMSQDEEENEEQKIDNNTNLLELGPDAWDDSGIIEQFDKDIKSFAKSHNNQITDMSKVPSMISQLNLETKKYVKKKNIFCYPRT